MMIIYFPQIPELLLFHCDTPSRGIASAVIFPTETRLNRQKSLQLRLWFHGRPSTNHHSHIGIGGSVFYLIGTDRKKADT